MQEFLGRVLQGLAGRLPDGGRRALLRVVARDLDMLAMLWGTDKAPGRHGYTRHYARHLKRRSVRCMLEIGIGGYEDPKSGGNSLRMWRSYFPKATIYGLDIHKKLLDEPRIVALHGDQSDPQSLAAAVRNSPPFDLIVDDGSHLASDIVTSFEVLFPKLKPGGTYAIEDLHTAYLSDFGGGPPGTPDTAMALVKSILDDLNSGTRALAGVHAYPGLVLIQTSVDSSTQAAENVGDGSTFAGGNHPAQRAI